MDNDERVSWAALRNERLSEPGAQEGYEAARLAFTLGADVRRLREARGWSQTELARQADMTQSAVARFEAGGTVPTLPVLYRLTRALGVRLDVSISETAHGETAAGKARRATPAAKAKPDRGAVAS